MNKFKNQKKLKSALRNRERLFAGWVSYAHPSIMETFARAGFDFTAIDMEHTSITVEQATRVIAASQAEDTPCLPRPVSHSNDWTKPLLEAGADGMLFPMVNTPEEVQNLIEINKFPPVGKRSYGVNRAHGYGFDFDVYTGQWNDSSILMLQIESVQAVENIEELIAFPEVDGVMVGPYDISGSLGVPGQVQHPDVIEASKKVIAACKKAGISCGTQLGHVDQQAIDGLFDLGYTYAILGSDLFVLWKWAESMQGLMNTYR